MGRPFPRRAHHSAAMASDPTPPPEVSVLLPVRDGAATLAEALDSVLASRGVALEVVCVDDGSQDGTADLLARHSERDARLRVVRTKPLGIVSALNTGLEQARAGIVARTDADDTVHPDRFALQRDALLHDPGLALVGCQVTSFREGGLAEGYRLYTEWVNGLVTEEDIAREAFVECPVPHPTWAFRADTVRALGGYHDEPWPEDLDLLYRLLGAGLRVGKLARPLHRWRDHDSRLSRSDPRYRKEAFAAAKAHHIGSILPMEGAVVWGAGKTGKRWVRLLEAEGIPTRTLIDVSPARQSTNWHGIPIVPPETIPLFIEGWRSIGLVVLCAVASRGARSEIREELTRIGLVEGTDFSMVA